MFRILKDYIDTYDENIVLHIIGKKDRAIQKYYDELDGLLSDFGIGEHVHWVGEVNEQVILSYFLGSDFYLNCSEHEGFCVPVIEAQSLRLPVIARKLDAVCETLGGNQLVLDDDVREYSSAIHVLSQNSSYKTFLINEGLHNYQTRFTNTIIEEKFKKLIEEL